MGQAFVVDDQSGADFGCFQGGFVIVGLSFSGTFICEGDKYFASYLLETIKFLANGSFFYNISCVQPETANMGL